MKASKALKLEKTNVAVKATVSFNSPGNYLAPYGKTVVRVSGRGQSGNATTGGNYGGESYVSTNPNTGGNYAGESYVSTNPTTGGNYAGESYVSTNPATGGNYAGESYVSTNPSTGGNYAGESYVSTNPTTGGNYAGETYYYTNPATPGNTTPGTCVSTLYQYFTEFTTVAYDEFPGPCGPLGTSSCDPFFIGDTRRGDHCKVYDYYTNPSSSNPPTPGNDVYTPYYNPTVPGNDNFTPYYNPTIPGNNNFTPYYNPVVPGTNNFTPYYNPVVPGTNNFTPYYNPVVPGTDNFTPYYNPVVPGNAGPPANILGVTFPGGAADSVAPTVSPTATAIAYNISGYSVTVPSGGYINLDNI